MRLRTSNKFESTGDEEVDRRLLSLERQNAELIELLEKERVKAQKAN